MQVVAAHSPNFGAPIPVEFVVLHYTACTLAETLQLFSSSKPGTCAHFVLDEDGTVYDLGNFLSGPILQGAHAGKSHFDLAGKTWEAFNTFSIGIEIVNLNGNFFSYPDVQYTVLVKLLQHLNQKWPNLRHPERIVGHEHIAGFRGKLDPGMCFDWTRLFTSVFPKHPAPKRPAVLTPKLLQHFETRFGKTDLKHQDSWAALNTQLEQFVATHAAP